MLARIGRSRGLGILRRGLASAAETDVNPVILERPGSKRRVHLIGTAHISAASAEAVRELIRKVKPDSVYLELDEDRARKMRERWSKGSGSRDEDEHDLASTIAKAASAFAENPGKAVSQLPAMMLGKSLSRFYKGFARLGFVPGGEFKAAIEEAEALGAELHMMDRESGETLRHLSNAIVQDAPGWLTSMLRGGPDVRDLPELAKLSQVSSMKEMAEVLSDATRSEVRRLIQFIRKTSPNVLEAMLDERDLLMAKALRGGDEVSDRTTVIVGVVGKAHMDGIEGLFHLSDGEFARKESDMAAFS